MNSIYLITNPVETNKTLLSHCTQSRELRFANRMIGPILQLLIPYVIMVGLNTKVIFQLRESKRSCFEVRKRKQTICAEKSDDYK